MKQEKHLEEFALADARWAEGAWYATCGNWDLSEVTKDGADELRTQFLDEEISINELRMGVAWANALDKEAVDLYGADLTQGEQIEERIARRLMHLAGREALNGLRNWRLRMVARTATYRASSTPDLSRFGAHDIQHRYLVQ